MKYENLKKYNEAKFRRITGIKRATFDKMTEILGNAEKTRRCKGGRKPSLSIEDMLLATLEYLALLDSGYQGINEFLPNALTPYKSSKKHPLSYEQKAFNTKLSRFRAAIEHINREIKIFRICKETYRGKGQRGLIRVKLIACLLNHRRLA